MLAEGVEFMVIGMGTVFAFLTLMVIAMHCTTWLIASYCPPAPEPDPAAPTPTTTAEEAEIAVVLAAAYRWRQGQGD